jgi:hypothetical protein
MVAIHMTGFILLIAFLSHDSFRRKKTRRSKNKNNNNKQQQHDHKF